MTKPSQVARMLEGMIHMQIPFFIKGGVGVGKSQVVAQATKKISYSLTDIRLSQMDPTDIKGFPSPNIAQNVMNWLPADFLPPMLVKGKPNKTKGVLFFDELPSAPQATQAACYQLFLDRKVGSYELPEGWAMGAAGNRDIDRSIVNRMPAALANRLVHIDYEVDLDDFVTHAMSVGMAPENIAFLRFREKLLHSFDPKTNPMAFPTPRSWMTVDKIMKYGFSPDDRYALIQGTVGEGAAIEHDGFLRTIKDLPTVDEIKLNPDTVPIPTEPATMFALTTGLAMATTKTGFAGFMKFVERMETEWQVIYVRDCLRLCNEIKLGAEFTRWSIAHSDVIV